MNLATLSLEQAPPLSVPMRFFLTAPLFGVAAALVLVTAGGDAATASRWAPAVLTATHLTLLGMVVMVMFGAMQQMLPVVAGAPIARPRLVGGVVHVLWTAGAAALGFGLLASSPPAMAAAGALLLAGALTFVGAAAASLHRASARSETVTAMRLSLASFAVALALGVALAGGYAGLWPLWRVALTDLHLMWALIGWIGLLIVGVSYQVVPMFQMTPPYPPALRRYLSPGLFALLLLRTALSLLVGGAVRPAQLACEAALAVGLLLFAAATLSVQARRRRKLPDPLLGFFRLGMAGLGAAALLHLAARAGWPAGDAPSLAAGVCWVFGMVLPIVMGMLHKIVPFLVWFHLQGENTARMKAGRPLLRLPNMKDAIPERRTRALLQLYLAALPLLAAAPFHPSLLLPGGVLLGLAFALCQLNLVTGWRCYLAHARAARAAA